MFHLALIAIVFFISFLISLNDLRSHQIPNRLTLALFFSLTFERNSLNAPKTFLIAVLATIITILFTVGMGDLKLFLALLVTQGTGIITLEFFTVFSLCSVLLAIFELTRLRSFKADVPLAPAILIPFLLHYSGLSLAR